MAYSAQGNKVVIVHHDGEIDVHAHCDDAPRAAEMLNRARYLNDVKRHYTASARRIAKAAGLRGFRWINDPQS